MAGAGPFAQTGLAPLLMPLLTTTRSPAQIGFNRAAHQPSSWFSEQRTQRAVSVVREAHRTRPRVIVRSQRDTKQEQPVDVPSSAPSRQPQPQAEPQEEELEAAFRFFDASAYLRPFDTPWSAQQTLLGMLVWGGSFTAVGLLFLPIAAALAGPEGFRGLSQESKSLFALANQVCETAVGIWAVRSVTKGYEPLPEDLFNYDFRAPFRKPDGWLAWGLLGVLLSPVFVYLSAVATEALGYGMHGGVGDGKGTVDAVVPILSLDPVTFAGLFATTAILAPLLEETVFRGFLLASLTKFMPVPLAVVLSSLAFGLVHLAPRDFPQLTSLGILLGFTYVRSRNLLTPMLIHGTWNGAVLTVLCLLASQGVDLEQLLSAQ